MAREATRKVVVAVAVAFHLPTAEQINLSFKKMRNIIMFIKAESIDVLK